MYVGIFAEKNSVSGRTIHMYELQSIKFPSSSQTLDVYMYISLLQVRYQALRVSPSGVCVGAHGTLKVNR